MSRGKRFKLTFLVIVIVLVVAAGLLVSGNIFRSEAAIPDERIAEVTSGDLALTVVATGYIVPIATVEVKSKASGLIKSIYVDDGDVVEAGQKLVELDKELLEAELREVEANRLAVVAREQEAQSNHASAVSLKAKLEMDLKNLENKVVYLEKQVNRYESLFKEKLIPHNELEQRERDHQEAVFLTEALRSELLMQDARIDAADKAVVRVKAEVSQAEATLDRARENLRYATIRSPLKATVLKRHVEAGDAVSSILQLGSQATLIFTLGDMNTVYFEGRVDETDVGRVFDLQDARVRVDAFRDNPFPGQVIRISPLGEEEDNVIGFEVRVSIEDRESILRAQMSANAEIIVEQKNDILLIPETAIIYDKDRNTFTELYDPSFESQKRRVPIEIGISDGTTTELVSGLSKGDQVLLGDTGGIL